MQPEQPVQTQQTEQPQIPAIPLAQPVATPPAPLNNHRRTVLALWLMIGPTALIVVTIILFAIANYFMMSSTGGSDMFGQQSSLRSVVNILLFLLGTVVVISWLPGLIVGIILLATKKK